jgi:CRISPR-associated protein Csx14
VWLPRSQIGVAHNLTSGFRIDVEVVGWEGCVQEQVVWIIDKQAILISTLGTEPQVVTATLDLLLRKGENIRRVDVLHTVLPETPVADAVATLKAAFPVSTNETNITLELHPFKQDAGELLSDIDTMPALESAFRELYQQVHKAKHEDLKVHLGIAGGRKPLAIYAMTVAQMLFEDDDCLWYLGRYRQLAV